ncbi:hypothetical protein [Brevibacillus parabrevis]|uniref:hypothetical protein n=1 Tax=Brevibacillus parabrevis TaxID=54914 RepID=UPI000A774F9D|nr:hypothetical protein [Brevibacillus parabrevis]
MRQSNKETFAQGLNRQFFSVDFHDDLAKESSRQNVEMSQDFYVNMRDLPQSQPKRK